MSVPILLVTGFLGAGKTTLINNLLQGDHGLRIAAIVNDFGSINIDAALLDGAAEGVIGLKNGCICCSLQGDLLRTIKTVLRQDPLPQLIVIEASGVADPAGIVQSLIDPVIWHQARLETIACVIDAPDVAARDDDPLWRAQVVGSDLICLAKTDGMSKDALNALTYRFNVLGKSQVFDLADPLPITAMMLEGHEKQRQTTGAPLRDDRFVYREWQFEGRVNMQAFQQIMEELAPTLLRAKGLLAFKGQEHRLLFQLTGTRATLARGPKGDAQDCQLVLIGDRKSFDADRAMALLSQLQE